MPEHEQESAASAPNQGVAQATPVVVDRMPEDPAVLAQMTPEERAAVYLNSIRKMLVFFTVLTVIGLIAGVIVGIIGIQAIQHAQTCTGFGC
jgi:hypothetical protein